jgi:aspartate-semialdehyde dehydrogenase
MKFRGGDIAFRNSRTRASKAWTSPVLGGRRAVEAFRARAVRAGAIVVDNSSAFRMDPNTPLVVPKSMPGDAQAQRHHREPELRGHRRGDAVVAAPPEDGASSAW